MGEHVPRHAVLFRADPWLWMLQSNGSCFSLESDDYASSISIVTVAFKINATEVERQGTNLIRTLSFARLRQAREAIDLLYMSLTYNPKMIVDYFRERLQLSSSEVMAARELEGGASFRLQITIVANAIDDPTELVRLSTYLVETLDDQASMDASFHRVRMDFEGQRNESRIEWRQGAARNPTVLRFSVLTPRGEDDRTEVREEYLQIILAWIKYAEKMFPSSWNDAASNEMYRHVPVVVDQVSFRLELCLITHRTLAIAHELHTICKGFVVCDGVRLALQVDPCSHENVTKLLNVLKTVCGPDGLEISTDCNQEDQPCSIMPDTIIQGVASCDGLKTIDLSGLMTSRSRRVVYRALLQHLLTRSTPCSLSIEKTLFTAEDTHILREEYSTWRLQHPEGKLRVKKLKLEITDPDNCFPIAMIDLLDNIEQLYVINRDKSAPLLEETMIVRFLDKFSRLRTLHLTDVEIASFNVFFQRRDVPLQSLTLVDFVLHDRFSFVQFVRALGDPATPLGRTLRELSIEETDERVGVFRLNAQEADELRCAMVSNDVLMNLTICFYAHRSKFQMIRELFQETEGRIVVARLCGSQGIKEMGKRVAFLSVINTRNAPFHALHSLDLSMVREIWAYLIPTTVRQIIVDMREM